MATTRLSNLIEPKVFTAYSAQQTTVKSALINSGALFSSDEISAQASAAGSVFEAPSFNPYDWTESNVISDDNTQLSVPANITAGAQIGQKDYRSKDWSTMALSSVIIGSNVMEAIANITSTYWTQDIQALTLAKLAGIEVDNIANDGGDMVNNVAKDVTGAAAASTLANYNTILDTIQTMGDSMDKLATIIMHSQVYTNLQKQEPTAFSRPSETFPFVTYYGKRVIIDDGMPVVTGTNKLTYTTYLLGQGAFAYAEGTFDDATEIWRNPAAGNGGGEERLYMRKRLVVHPLGFTSNATVVSGAKSPTMSAYSSLGAFDRQFKRKNVKIAILKSNG